MDPASSSSSSSSFSSLEEDDDDDRDVVGVVETEPLPKSFDDLPSDDSVSLSSSTSSSSSSDEEENDALPDDDDDEEAEGGTTSEEEEEQEEEEEEGDVPIYERLTARRNGLGASRKRREGGRRRSDDDDPLTIAKRRLAELRASKMKGSRATADADAMADTTGDDDGDGEEDSEQGEKDVAPTEEEGRERKRKREAESSKATKKKKKSKHAPTEVSSTRSSYFSRGAPSLDSSGLASRSSQTYKPRDPRMQSLSGHLDENVFARRYAFLEELEEKEIGALKERVKARETTGRKGQRKRRKLGLTKEEDGGGKGLEEDRKKLQTLLQLRSNRECDKQKREAKTAVKRKIREEITTGKRSKGYHLKRSEMKRMELEARFDALRKEGGDDAVEKVVKKKLKRDRGKAKGRRFG